MCVCVYVCVCVCYHMGSIRRAPAIFATAATSSLVVNASWPPPLAPPAPPSAPPAPTPLPPRPPLLASFFLYSREELEGNKARRVSEITIVTQSFLVLTDDWN